jgi:hypothetical protein
VGFVVVPIRSIYLEESFFPGVGGGAGCCCERGSRSGAGGGGSGERSAFAISLDA